MDRMEATGNVEGGSLGDRKFKAVTASEMAVLNPPMKNSSTTIINAEFEDAEETSNDDQYSQKDNSSSPIKDANNQENIAKKEADDKEAARLAAIAKKEADDKEAARLAAIAKKEADDKEAARLAAIAKKEADDKEAARLAAIAKKEADDKEAARLAAIAKKEADDKEAARLAAIAKKEADEKNFFPWVAVGLSMVKWFDSVEVLPPRKFRPSLL